MLLFVSRAKGGWHDDNETYNEETGDEGTSPENCLCTSRACNSSGTKLLCSRRLSDWRRRTKMKSSAPILHRNEAISRNLLIKTFRLSFQFQSGTHCFCYFVGAAGDTVRLSGWIVELFHLLSFEFYSFNYPGTLWWFNLAESVRSRKCGKRSKRLPQAEN